MLNDRERLILLNGVAEMGSARLRRLLEAFGDLDRLWGAGTEQLQQAGAGPELAARIDAARGDPAWLRREAALAQQHGVAILTLEDDGYPAQLRTIHDPPLALYIKGAFTANDEIAVAVVGSRHASAYGLHCAERLGYDLALRGVTVVSGLARGIDAAAHQGALKASGRTLAVLGSGIGRLYPEEHRALAEAVSRRGAVLLEYPMMAEPLPYNFPQRNRIISGLSLGVVVVEAAQRSGALITADCALEQGREVFAVPGPVTAATSQGTHHLLRQGARLAASVEDVLDELRLTPRSAPVQPLTGTEQQVLACVRQRGAVAIDAIIARSGVGAADASTALLQLELKGLVTQRPGKRFIRKEDGVTGDT